MTYEQLGQIIKRGREMRNMTQQDIAQKLDVTVAAVSNWETGARAPRIQDFIRLVNMLEIADQIFVLPSYSPQQSNSEIERIKSQLFLLQQRVNQMDKITV